MGRQIVLLEAYKKFYEPYAVDLGDRTKKKLGYHFARWARLTGNPPIKEISEEHFVRFRTAGVAAGLSARSIETVITDVITVLRRCKAVGVIDQIPEPGRRLRYRPVMPVMPSLGELGVLWKFASCGGPFRRGKPAAFGSVESLCRTWLATAYFTGLRLGDLIALDWSQVRLDEAVLETQAAKTGKLCRFPLHPILLQRLSFVSPRRRFGRVFGISQTPSTYRRMLRNICTAAETRVITPQEIRRAAGTAAECGRPGGGGLLLGHALPGAQRFYIDTAPLLREVVLNMPVPPGWPASSKAVSEEASLLSGFRRLSTRDREVLMSMTERLLR